MQEGVDVLYHLYFEKYLKVAIGASEGIRKKPAPDTAREALRLLQVSEKDALYVGDSDVDIATARNAGMDCVSVTWGLDVYKRQGYGTVPDRGYSGGSQ